MIFDWKTYASFLPKARDFLIFLQKLLHTQRNFISRRLFYVKQCAYFAQYLHSIKSERAYLKTSAFFLYWKMSKGL